MNDMKIPAAKPSVLLVLGMHRSGTSALAGTFSQLGLRLGDELMPATADANPKGYFEHVQRSLLEGKRKPCGLRCNGIRQSGRSVRPV